MGVTLKLESEKVVMAGNTLKVFMNLLDSLQGISRGQEEGYKSRTIMMLANGIYSKLCEEIQDDVVPSLQLHFHGLFRH